MALGDLVYFPPRSGPTLWEIGVPDRTAAEFYVPDPDPRYANKLYLNIDRYEHTCTLGQCITSINNKEGNHIIYILYSKTLCVLN